MGQAGYVFDIDDVQALRDAGCDAGTIEAFLRYKEENRRQEQVALLGGHRQRLLDHIHADEKRISCLDYLLYQMNRREEG